MIGTAYYERDEVNGKSHNGLTMTKYFTEWTTLDQSNNMICSKCKNWKTQIMSRNKKRYTFFCEICSSEEE